MQLNKLKGTIVYVAGPIDDAKDLGVGWRKRITPLLKQFGIGVIDPTNKATHDSALAEDEYTKDICASLKEKEDYESLHSYGKSIRAWDLRAVDKADFLIVYLDYDTIMTGSIEEVVTANRSKKPILIVCKQGRKKIANWIYWMIPPKYIFENFEELFRYLRSIDDGTVVDEERWRFFDWKKIIED